MVVYSVLQWWPLSLHLILLSVVLLRQTSHGIIMASLQKSWLAFVTSSFLLFYVKETHILGWKWMMDSTLQELWMWSIVSLCMRFTCTPLTTCTSCYSCSHYIRWYLFNGKTRKLRLVLSTFANQRDPSAKYFSSLPETYLLHPLLMYVSTLLKLLKVLFGLQDRSTFAKQGDPGSTLCTSPTRHLRLT